MAAVVAAIVVWSVACDLVVFLGLLSPDAMVPYGAASIVGLPAGHAFRVDLGLLALF